MTRFLTIGLGLVILAAGGPRASAQNREEVAALVQQLQSKDVAAQSRAAAALARLGPDAREGIPPLVDALGHEIAGPVAAQALARIGPAAVPALAKALQSDRVHARANAAAALKRIGPEAKDAVPPLIEVVKKDRVTPKKDRAVQGESLVQPVAIPRIQAIGALGRIGPAARDAVPVLIDVLKEKDPLEPARIEAAIALGQIGPGAKEAVPALAEAVKEPETKSGPLRLHAAAALGQIGPAAKEAVPALITLVKDRKAGPARVVAVQALGGIGPDASPAVRTLEEALDDPALRGPARQALEKIQGNK